MNDRKVKNVLSEMGIDRFKLNFELIGDQPTTQNQDKKHPEGGYDKKLEERCQIEASGAFLTESFTEQDDHEAAKLIEETQGAMDTLTRTIEQTMTDGLNEESKPLYGVIWHYEGQPPYLNTYRAIDEDEAQFLFNGDMIDHESNAICEFHVDSIQRIEL